MIKRFNPLVSGKAWLVYLLRLVAFLFFVWSLLSHLTARFTKPITAGDFFVQGLWTLLDVDDFGTPYFSFIKLLIVLSVFGFGYLSMIAFISELSEAFYHVVKFHSRSYWAYLGLRFRLFLRFYLWDCLAWSLGAMLVYGLTEDRQVLTYLVQFLVVNGLAGLLISCISRNAFHSLLYLVLLYFLQPLLQKSVYLTLPILVALLVCVSVTPVGSRLRGDES